MEKIKQAGLLQDPLPDGTRARVHEIASAEMKHDWTIDCWSPACGRGIMLLAQVAVQVRCGEAAEMAGEAKPHEQTRVRVGRLRGLVVNDPCARQLSDSRRQPQPCV